MALLTGGQILVEAIKREGIDTIFGLPGIQLDNLFDALYASRESLRVIHTRHEQATSYMADGYARTTGRVGTCLVVPGPGLLNATAGLSTAYACSSPVLCLTGQIESKLIGGGRGELHEIPNQLGMLGSVTKWAARADNPAMIPGLVAEAFRLLRSGRPRPVALEIPPDVLGAQVEIELPAREEPDRFVPEAGALRRAAEILRGAERPLIFAGGGVIGSGAWDEVRALAEELQAPVIMTENGRGILSSRHSLAHTGLSARYLLPQADAILAVGTRLLEAAVWIGLPQGVPLIQIDVDPEEVGRNASPAVGIVGDARLSLEGLLDAVKGGNARPSREAESLAVKEQVEDLLFELQPQHSYAAAIREALPDDGIIVSEMTQMGYYSGVGMPIYEPRTYLTPGYQGTLGYGYATALGAQVGSPDKKVVAICGDGGFMYNVQELATAKQHNIPLVGIVFNDGAFGNVKRIQKARLGGATYGSELQNPDFVALAKAFGIGGMRAETPEALGGALREALATNGPVLIDAPIGEVRSLWSVLYPSAPETADAGGSVKEGAMPTVFSRVISGEFPGRFVWRDEQCVAFLTINPLRSGHTLVVPIEEVDHWLDLDPALAAHLITVAQTVGKAIQQGFGSARIGLIVAGFEVPHTHLHLIPTDTMADLDFARAEQNPDPAALDAAAETIREALRAMGHGAQAGGASAD